METFEYRLKEVKKTLGFSDERIRSLARIGRMSVQKFVFIEHEMDKLRQMHACRLIHEQQFIRRLTLIWQEAQKIDWEISEFLYQNKEKGVIRYQ